MIFERDLVKLLFVINFFKMKGYKKRIFGKDRIVFIQQLKVYDVEEKFENYKQKFRREFY